MRFFLRKFIADIAAATAIEYALFVAGIGLAIAATLFVFGDELLATYQLLSDSIAEGLASRI